jgi:hypothetical protein
LLDGQTDILQRDPRAIAMADAIDLKRWNLGRLGSLHDHFRNNDAQALMPDIGRLAYRVWCGKVRGQAWPRPMAKVCGSAWRALRYDEKLVATQDAFGAPELDLDS